MAARTRSRDNVRFIVKAMAHHIALHSRRPNQDYLSPCRVALGILNTTKRPCRIAGAVEDDPRGGCKCGRDMINLLPLEPDAIFVLQPSVEILHELGSIDGDGCEGHGELDALWEFV